MKKEIFALAPSQFASHYRHVSGRNNLINGRKIKEIRKTFDFAVVRFLSLAIVTEKKCNIGKYNIWLFEIANKIFKSESINTDYYWLNKFIKLTIYWLFNWLFILHYSADIPNALVSIEVLIFPMFSTSLIENKRLVLLEIPRKTT